MLKRYIADCSEFNIYLNLADGREIKMYFSGKNPITKQRFVDVDDKLIQDALENSPLFGKYFYKSTEFDWMKEGDKADGLTVIKGNVELQDSLKKAEKVAEKQDKKQVEDKEPTEPVEKSFPSYKALKDCLHDEHGVAYSKLAQKGEVVVNLALEYGIIAVIENLKK